MSFLKVLTVVGARPQFIKAAAVSPLLRRVATEVIVHTGQHYDFNMCEVFFDELALPKPDYNLNIGSGTHGVQTGRMLEAIEKVIIEEKPDWVLVYGDTNSTLAGALAAVKIHVPVAHVEAGLRSFDRLMPEEVNRILTDHASELLFAPTERAFRNLEHEGLSSRAVVVGDVMADMLLRMQPRLNNASDMLESWNLQPNKYILLTLHRPSNVDDPERLSRILSTLSVLKEPILFPVHPRTRERIREFNLMHLVATGPFRCIPPLSYIEMLVLEGSARLVVTDSGGIQKEAYLLGVPCVTLRKDTEWLETVEAGWNRLVDPGSEDLLLAIREHKGASGHPSLYGDGHAAERVVSILTTSGK